MQPGRIYSTISISPMIAQSIEHYQLGVAQKLHSQRDLRYGCSGCTIFFLFLGTFPLCLMLLHVLPWSALFAYEEATPMTTFTQANVSLLGILTIEGLIMGLAGVGFFFLIRSQESMYDMIYECSDGFLWINEKTQQLKLALTWKQLQQVRHELYRVKSHSRRHYGGSSERRAYYITYRTNEGTVQEREISFRELWERCSFELEQHAQAT